MSNLIFNLDNFENTSILKIVGEVRLENIHELFAYYQDNQSKFFSKVIIDLTATSYCDSAAVAFFKKVIDCEEKKGKTVSLKGASAYVENLLLSLNKKNDILPKEEKKRDFRQELKNSVLLILRFIGEMFWKLFLAVKNPSNINFREFANILNDVGTNACFLISMIGFLVGIISAFQGAPSLAHFGAQIFLINLVGLGSVREMAPLLTAVLISGRTASTFAATIGSMKSNNELDALNVMGIDAMNFLILPRVLAVAIIAPILSLFFILFSLVGCAIVMNTFGYNLDIFFNQLKTAINLKDVLSGLVKVFFFGIAIAATGCFQGLKTKYGATEVGVSTTKAVVSSLIVLILLDGVFATIFYVFKI